MKNMNMNIKSNLFKVFGMLFIATTVYSCSDGSLPARKKMPQFSSYDGFEGEFNNNNNEANPGSFAFATSNVDLMLNGTMQRFVSVSLPSPANDSVAVSLVNAIKPFAMPILSAWAQQQRHGVIIDLCSHTGGETHRSDYVLQKQGNFSIPVVVMWDGASASRVAELKNIVQDMPSITLSCTSNNDSSENFMGK
jgi:hypothetical protein